MSTADPRNLATVMRDVWGHVPGIEVLDSPDHLRHGTLVFRAEDHYVWINLKDCAKAGDAKAQVAAADERIRDILAKVGIRPRA